ncbi:arsenical resistance-3 (ACR3) family protein [Pleurotus pulmonarius]
MESEKMKIELDSNQVSLAPPAEPVKASKLFRSLSFFDRWLALFILVAMILGVVIGVYAENGVHSAFGGAQWNGVSIPVMIGLLLMMWPVLTKIKYECLGRVLSSRRIWLHMVISFVLNWIVAPFIMLGLAWATLPEASLERERKGVLLIGVAMVLIWSGLAQGDMEYCAILVGMNSLLQIVLFAPYALLFLNILGSNSGSDGPLLHLHYSEVSTSVGIYLGIPLAAGLVTRFVSRSLLSPRSFERFLKIIGPIALLGLLYTIIVLFAYQGKRIVDNIGSVFRIFVPLILYFIIVWFLTFFTLYYLSTRKKYRGIIGGYDMAVVQAFTAGSNNFELAIAVAVANFGTDSPEALAATIGPLVEVPVLLGLTYFALWIKRRTRWEEECSKQGD